VRGILKCYSRSDLPSLFRDRACVRHALKMHWNDSLLRYVMLSPSLRNESGI
jgi:hypothetical protein